jgi:hypothetical protein
MRTLEWVPDEKQVCMICRRILPLLLPIPQDNFYDTLDEIRQGADQYQDENVGHSLAHICHTRNEIEAISKKIAHLPKNDHRDHHWNDETNGNIPGSLRFGHAAHTLFPSTQGEKIAGM